MGGSLTCQNNGTCLSNGLCECRQGFTGLACSMCVPNFFIESVILNTCSKIFNLKKLCNFELYSKWKLLYRASVDGYASKDFHKKCDGHSQTLAIIKTTKNYVFGGYKKKAWTSFGYYSNDKSAFIFSLINKENNPQIMKAKSPESVLGRPTGSYGLRFADDFVIADSSNNNTESFSNLCDAYYCTDHIYEAKSFLAGSKYFQVKEIEVYKSI